MPIPTRKLRPEDPIQEQRTDTFKKVKKAGGCDNCALSSCVRDLEAALSIHVSYIVPIFYYVFCGMEKMQSKILGGDQLLVILCGYGTKSLELGTSFLSMTMICCIDRGHIRRIVILSSRMQACERYKIPEVIKVARGTIRLHWKFPFDSYACSDSLLLTPLNCDDIHDVTPRVSALAGCDILVSEPLVIEKIRSRSGPRNKRKLFRRLKAIYEMQPILSMPDDPKRCSFCDSSNQGLGCVLMQRGKVENAIAEMLRGLDQLMKRKEGGVIIRVFDVLYLKRCMEGNVGHMFFGLKLEKFGRLNQSWYKKQQIRVEVGDKVMLEVSSWKDVVHFGKKEMLAPIYVGPFEIIKGICPMAY
ncbi:hypothetical protein Tco_1338612 [Tanacetum coccineum]